MINMLETLSDTLKNAQRAQVNWGRAGFKARGQILHNLAHLLRTQQEELAKLITEEMYKPITQARAEIEKCARVCTYYQQHGEAYLRDEVVKEDTFLAQISYLPLGAILAVMPWNFPFWQVFRVLAPNLMAGNTLVVKHASSVPKCADKIADLCAQAGAGAGIYTNLQIPASNVAEVIAHPAIAAVTITGSEAAGRSVAMEAARNLKKTVLELGGSDPYLVLGGADLAVAIEACATSRLINNGQSCVAAKRFIVVGPLYEWFIGGLKERFAKVRMGDPMQDDTELGPLINRAACDLLHHQVQASLAKGAECVIGGQVIEGEHAYYPPTILKNVKPGMPAFDEELFGPVAAVIRAADDEDAVHLANQSRFSLGAAVFASPSVASSRLVREGINTGMLAINQMVQSDPRVPFGGNKASGYGRELGMCGIREFVNIKTTLLA